MSKLVMGLLPALACCLSACRSDGKPPAAAGDQAQPARPAKAAEPNWVTVSPTGRYLMFEDGSPFVPLGISMDGDHINMDYYGAVSIGGKRYSFGDNHFGALFKDMRAHGENFLRIDIESTSLMPRPDIERMIRERKIQFLEDPVGVFNEEYAQRIDRLVALAEAHGIYLSIVLLTHTCNVTVLADNLDLYPYHVSKGGPLRDMNDLLTNARAKQLWLNRMRYISDRWGHSRQIAMWELYNEMLNCGCTDPEAGAAWTAEMGSALRKYEQQRYGKAHPVIVSTEEFVPEHDFFVRSPGTDLMVTHYYRQGTFKSPGMLAQDIHDCVLKNLKSADYSRPFIENERTLGKPLPISFQKELEHTAAWSMLASGAANPGCPWVRMGPWGCFRTKEVISDTHAAMRKIIGPMEFATVDSRPMDIGSSNPDVKAIAVGDGVKALGWVQHVNPDDYDIEMLRAWRDGQITDPKVAPYLAVTWIRLIRDRVPPRKARDVTDRFGHMIAKAAGLSPAEGVEFADRFLSDPSGFTETAADLQREKTRKPSRQQLQAALSQIRGTLEDVEQEHDILRKTYKNHPRVSAKLTLRRLKPGPHELTWYDDTTGKALGSVRFEGKDFTAQTPEFRKHIAFVLR